MNNNFLKTAYDILLHTIKLVPISWADSCLWSTLGSNLGLFGVSFWSCLWRWWAWSIGLVFRFRTLAIATLENKEKIGSCKTVKMGICWFFKLGFSGLTFLEWQTCQFLYCLVTPSMMTIFSNLFISNFIFVIYRRFSRSRQLGGLLTVLWLGVPLRYKADKPL